MISFAKYIQHGVIKQVRKICLVNRYYPPNPGIAGEEASGLVGYLSKTIPDCKITVIHIDAPYLFEGVSPRYPLGNVVTLKTFLRDSQNIGVRFFRNLIEGYRLIKKAVEDADLIISMTDPPLLNYWAGILCKRNKIPWIYWAVDLYPHAYKAATLANENNLIYRHLKRSFRKHVPSFLIALGDEQSKYLQEHWDRKVPSVVLPCGIQNYVPKSELPYWKKNDNKIYFAYAGNMSEPHDPDFLLDFIGCLDEKKHKCILAMYGSKSQSVLNRVKTHPAVEVIKNMNRDELSHIDVHLVSLLPEWTHVSVPSKAVSAVCAGQAVLFNGSQDSDTWQYFKHAGWIIAESTSKILRKKRIKDILIEASDETLLAEMKKNAISAKKKLLDMETAAYGMISDWIEKHDCYRA